MLAKSPVAEESFEISLDCYGFTNGPKKGRLRAMQKVYVILLQVILCMNVHARVCVMCIFTKEADIH